MKSNETVIAKPGKPPYLKLNQKGVLPIFAILVSVVLWGGSFAGMRIAVLAMNPWAVMWCRMTIALIVLIPFLGKLNLKPLQKDDWKLLLPMVLFQPCLYFFLESNALKFTTSSQAGIIASTLPLMVAFGAWMMFSERITRLTILGLVLSVFGVICLTLLGDGNVAINPYLGNLLEFFAMMSASVNMLLIKKLSSRYNTWTLTAMQVIAGVVFFSPGIIPLVSAGKEVWNPELLIVFILLGSLVTLGAFGLYNWGISKIAATKASAFINLVPVAAVIIGWVLLNESLTPWQCLAAFFVIGGVWISQYSTKK